jgi:YfiR/HmsC-like
MLLPWSLGLGLRIGLGWTLLCTTAWSAPPPNPLQLTTAEAVLGILAHTRWPQGAGRPLTLCLNERSTSALALRTLPDSVPPGKLAPVRLIDPEDAPHIGCDALYLGAGPWSGEALARLAGRPVLSVGEGAEFCTRGGMFCLVPRGQGVRVEVNLDAVARSGLHVHPQVLKLGQPRPGTTP